MIPSPPAAFTLTDLIVYALLPAIAALGGAIGVMYRHGIRHTRRVEEKLDACEDDHRARNLTDAQRALEIAEMRERVGRLEGRREGREEISDLVRNVIEEVRRDRT